MKKLGIAVLACMLLLSCGALADAQDAWWTLKADLYYHANRNCGKMENAVPISEAAAQAFDKYACPVCVQEDDDGSDVRAVVRGGTIVVRFSDSWLARPELTGVFGWSSDSEYTGEAAEELLAKYLHGNAYNSFMADYLADGSAESRARVPDVLPTSGELIMNTRHIGSSWYVIVRPAVEFDDSWEMYWRINGIRLRRDEASLRSNFDMQTLEQHKELRLSRAGGGSAVFEGENEEIQLTVYRELDTNIAVIYEKNADADFLEGAELRISGAPKGISLDGYMSGGQGVYCCTLTEAELALLQNGAHADVWHKSVLEDAQFMDSLYAEVRRGTGGSGIIDHEGNFVVEPKYDSVSRPDPLSFRVTTPRPFFCEEEDGGLTVLHGETLDTIVQLDETDKYLRGEYMNPSVFATWSGRGMQIRSLTDGAMHFELVFDETGNFGGEISNVDGYYRVLADGYPERLVAWHGDGPEAQAWLVDNSGNRVSERFQRITPLVWAKNEGVFLVEAFDAGDYDDSTFAADKQNYYEYGRAYDGSAYGSSWRCGLIDQDGKLLAEIKYTALEVIGDGDIWLTDEAGNSLIYPAGPTA